MKITTFLAFAAIAVSGIFSESGQAQQLPTSAAAGKETSRSVYLDVKYSTASSATDTSYRSAYGSYSKSQSKSKQLEIQVRNMSQLPGEFTVEWYFFGKPSGGSKRFLYDRGTEKVSLGAGAFKKITLESDELSSSRYRSYYGRYTYNSGDKADGWAVRALVDGEVIRVKASNSNYEKLMKEENDLKRYIESEKKSE